MHLKKRVNISVESERKDKGKSIRGTRFKVLVGLTAGFFSSEEPGAMRSLAVGEVISVF